MAKGSIEMWILELDTACREMMLDTFNDIAHEDRSNFIGINREFKLGKDSVLRILGSVKLETADFRSVVIGTGTISLITEGDEAIYSGTWVNGTFTAGAFSIEDLSFIQGRVCIPMLKLNTPVPMPEETPLRMGTRDTHLRLTHLNPVILFPIYPGQRLLVSTPDGMGMEFSPQKDGARELTVGKFTFTRLSREIFHRDASTVVILNGRLVVENDEAIVTWTTPSDPSWLVTEGFRAQDLVKWILRECAYVDIFKALNLRIPLYEPTALASTALGTTSLAP